MFYSHCTWTAHLDCCTAVPCSPRTWSGLLHGGHYYKVASRLNKVFLRVRPSDAKLDETCSKYSDSCIANRSSTQPTNSNRLNTQCSTLLAAALVWPDSAHSKTRDAFWSIPSISYKEKETVIKYWSGMTYSQKHAVRFKQSNSLSCPICSCQDSALHILSGCQHSIIRNMVSECHNIAGRLITKAISKSSLGSCLVSTDVGTADKHRAQNLQIPVTAES